jgi:hypothetical protein
MERAFGAPKGLETPLHGHMLLLGCLSIIFLKIITSLRQNILKQIVGLREVTNIKFHLVFIWFLFVLELGWEKESQRKVEKTLFLRRQTL